MMIFNFIARGFVQICKGLKINLGPKSLLNCPKKYYSLTQNYHSNSFSSVIQF